MRREQGSGAILALFTACTPASHSPNRQASRGPVVANATTSGAVAPSAAPQASAAPTNAILQPSAMPRSAEPLPTAVAPSSSPPPSAVVAPPSTPAKQSGNGYTLREVAEGNDFTFHRLGDGTLLVSVGLSVGRIRGSTLEWDDTLSDGLPSPWSPYLVPAIGSIEGHSLEGAWLELVSGCGTNPASSGYPIEYEFVRKGKRWRLLPMNQRRRWRDRTSYHVQSGYVYAKRKYALMQADNTAEFADGYVEEEERESIEHCIGNSFIVDDRNQPVATPELPKDLCVINVIQTPQGVALAGWDRQNRIIIELQQGEHTTRHTPQLPVGCHFQTTDSFSFSFVESGKAVFGGPTRCANPAQLHAYQFAFDGENFTAKTVLAAEAAPDTGASASSHPQLPSDPARYVENPVWRSSVVSKGVTWVTATTSVGTHCIGAPYEPEQVLYSSVSGRTTHRSSIVGVRFIEDCLQYRPRFAVLEELRQNRTITANDAERLAKAHHVPKSCSLVEMKTDNQHALGVPMDGNSDGSDECSRFVMHFGGRTWCFSLEFVPSHEENPESTTYYIEWRAADAY